MSRRQREDTLKIEGQALRLPFKIISQSAPRALDYE